MDKGHFVSVSEAQRTTLGDVIERYLVEVTPLMKSASEDTIRLKALIRKPIAKWSMANLSAARIRPCSVFGPVERPPWNWHFCVLLAFKAGLPH